MTRVVPLCDSICRLAQDLKFNGSRCINNAEPGVLDDAIRLRKELLDCLKGLDLETISPRVLVVLSIITTIVNQDHTLDTARKTSPSGKTMFSRVRPPTLSVTISMDD